MKPLHLLRMSWLKLANLSMQQKLLLIFIFLISLPITVVSYMSSNSIMHAIQDKAITSAMQVTSDATETMDRYIADLKRYTILPLYNANVQIKLEQEDTSWEKSSELHMFLSYLIHSKEEISAVYLVDKAGMIYYDKKSSTNTFDPKSRLANWQRLSKLHGITPVIIGKPTMNDNTFEQKPKQVFSVLRTIQSSGTLDDIGIIIIDVDIELLDGIVNALQSTTQGQALIADELGEPLSGDHSASLEALTEIRQHPSSYPTDSGHFEFIDSHHVRQLAVYNTSSQTGWTTIVTIPLSHIMEPVKHNSNKLITTTLIIISFALGVATLLSFALTSPLKNLVRLMRKVQHGHLDVWLHPKYNDEIGMIASHFNIMMIRIKGLLQEVAETEQRKRKADIRALQNQINPHFIYNTLESIRMLAEGSDEPRVAELTYLLGSQMRYGIVDSDKLVTVQQELEHVQNYVQLLCIRFPHKFSLVVDIPDELLHVPIIKLAFQPIVENAVFHGLDAKQCGGLLKITGWQEKHIVRFAITDNGIGMDEHTLNNLRRRLQDSEQNNKSGIGLRNVNERLRLNYGEECTLQVNSQLHEGTTVILSILYPGRDQ